MQVMAYDGSGRRVSKTRMRKADGGEWETELVTHYTGIGTEVREDNMNGIKVGVQAAYDYRAFGEQVDLEQKGDKVTENFTGKERDDETELNYFGARYLDPMLGLWTSVDPKRQFASPYLYAGNGVNPVNGVDPDGNVLMMQQGASNEFRQGVADAIAYLNARGAAGEIASLHSKSTVVTLAPAIGDDTGPRFDASTNTLYWNPKVGAVDVRGNMITPALLLVHEAAHANNWIDNPEEYTAKTMDQSPETTCDALGNVLFGDAEEKRVIQGPEWNAADRLNEPRRASHAGDEIPWE